MINETLKKKPEDPYSMMSSILGAVKRLFILFMLLKDLLYLNQNLEMCGNT